MGIIENEIAELEKTDVPLTKKRDFDKFWQTTIQLVKNTPLNTKYEIIDYPISSIEVRDLTFEGLDGTTIHTWYLLPKNFKPPFPVVINYHGAGGSRGYPSAYMQWLSMGYAVIAHDYRLQSGTTGSISGFESGSVKAGWFNMGLFEREKHYLYHSTTDALRVVELALLMDEIDKKRIAVNGGSQGGGTSLTVAALQQDVSLCMADVPSNCWFEKRLLDEAGGVGDMVAYLKLYPDKVPLVLDNFSYFDNLNLAERIHCPVLISCGMRDPVCPPKNIFAAFNRISSKDKTVIPYPFCKHEGGGSLHNEAKLAFIKKHFG